jgi:hypothetical protein
MHSYSAGLLTSDAMIEVVALIRIKQRQSFYTTNLGQKFANSGQWN